MKTSILSLLYFCLYCCFVLTSQAAQAKSYVIENTDIDESSGLAVSTRYDNVLWTHNDSGSPAILYAMSFTGKHLGSFFMDGEEPNDWEDIASFTYQGQSYLLLADTGDNLEFSLQGRLTVYKEPDIHNKSSSSLEPQWIINFSYPKNKSYDVESVAVDSIQKKVILMTKRNKKPRLFELPLIIKAEQQGRIFEAKKLAKLKYLKRPTSMDISADGKSAVVLTYGTVYLFKNPKHKSWKKVFKNPLAKIKYKGLYQPEGISFDATAKHLFISSEQLPAKLLMLTP